MRSSVIAIKILSQGAPFPKSTKVKYSAYQLSQLLSLYPVLPTEIAHFSQPCSLHFPELHFTSSVPLPEGQAGTA
jgi:hypothetical protein